MRLNMEYGGMQRPWLQVSFSRGCALETPFAIPCQSPFSLSSLESRKAWWCGTQGQILSVSPLGRWNPVRAAVDPA